MGPFLQFCSEPTARQDDFHCMICNILNRILHSRWMNRLQSLPIVRIFLLFKCPSSMGCLSGVSVNTADFLVFLAVLVSLGASFGNGLMNSKGN